jgi:cell division septation protein DedD
MTPREIARANIPDEIATLIAGRNIVVLVPQEDVSDSIVDTAWEFARAAASPGRAVALIDLSLEEPALHSRARGAAEEGIVDAFLFGASLEHVSSQQDVPGLYFIGVGTEPSDPAEVWESTRWSRLVRGFTSQGAVMLLFVPPAGLKRLRVTPDMVVTLSLHGEDSPQETAAITSFRDSGVPIARIVCEARTSRPSLHRAGPAILTDPEGRLDESEVKSGTLARVGLVLASTVAVGAVVTAAVFLLQGVGENPQETREMDRNMASSSRGDTQTTPGEAVVAPESNRVEQAIVADSIPGTAPVLTPAPEDSLFYSVQVAAMGSLNEAIAHANDLYAAGFPATVTVARPEADVTWYRVTVGAHATAGYTSETRQAMRRRGFAGGFPIRTPHALLINTFLNREEALAHVGGLRESGIPAYIVEAPGGVFRVLLGACETPDQARMTDSVLAVSGGDLSFSLVSRTGTAR